MLEKQKDKKTKNSMSPKPNVSAIFFFMISIEYKYMINKIVKTNKRFIKMVVNAKIKGW